MSAITKKLKGRMRKIGGKLTGTRTTQAKGKLEEAAGDIQLEGEAAAGNIKAGLNRGVAKVKQAVARAGDKDR